MSTRILLFLYVFTAMPCWAQTAPLLLLEGPIGPVSAEYVVDSLHVAALNGASFAVVQIDTPGGLDTSMRKIVRSVVNAPFPVVIWVGPAGARAASAGLFIVAAGDVAAMATGTNLGAAHPVGLGGEEGEGVEGKKVEEDAAAYIRSLAQRQGRKAEWFEKAVVESRSLSAEEALSAGVVDLLADDLQSLFARLDGRMVRKGRQEYRLNVGNAVAVEVEMSVRQKILSVLSNPNIAYLLLLLGFYGLFFELANAGAIFPGVLGAACLILAFVGLHSIPFNYAGVLLILLGLLLLLLEVKITSFGLLTVGGAGSLLLGSMMLFKTGEAYQRLSLEVVLPAVVATVAFFAFAVGKGLAAQRKRPISGLQGMVGKIGAVTEAVGPGRVGRVFVHGESWRAVSDYELDVGRAARVREANGMELSIEPLKVERSN